MLSNEPSARPLLGEVAGVIRELRFQTRGSTPGGRSRARQEEPGRGTLAQSPALWALALIGVLGLLVWGALHAFPAPHRVTPEGRGSTAASGSASVADLLALLERPASSSLGRELARAAPSRDLAGAIGRRLTQTRANDTALGGALADQGSHAFPVLERLRRDRPRLAGALYLRLAKRHQDREQALAGVAWLLLEAPPSPDGKELTSLGYVIRDLRVYGLGVDPGRLSSLAGILDDYLERSPDHVRRRRLAGLFRATLGPRAGTSTRGLEHCLREDWAAEVVEIFVAQLPQDATPAERRAVAALQARLR